MPWACRCPTRCPRNRAVCWFLPTAPFSTISINMIIYNNHITSNMFISMQNSAPDGFGRWQNAATELLLAPLSPMALLVSHRFVITWPGLGGSNIISWASCCKMVLRSCIVANGSVVATVLGWPCNGLQRHRAGRLLWSLVVQHAVVPFCNGCSGGANGSSAEAVRRQCTQFNLLQLEAE